MGRVIQGLGRVVYGSDLAGSSCPRRYCFLYDRVPRVAVSEGTADGRPDFGKSLICAIIWKSNKNFKCFMIRVNLKYIMQDSYLVYST